MWANAALTAVSVGSVTSVQCQSGRSLEVGLPGDRVGQHGRVESDRRAGPLPGRQPAPGGETGPGGDHRLA